MVDPRIPQVGREAPPLAAGQALRAPPRGRTGGVPGMTFRALGASILCMVLTAIYTNHTAIVVRETWTIPESVIPVPAILALLGLTDACDADGQTCQ